MLPNDWGLDGLRLGLLAAMWFRTFVNWKIRVAPIRSLKTLMFLATGGSRFHVDKPLRAPVDPQLVASPRTHGRDPAETAAGLADLLLRVGLLGPTPAPPDVGLSCFLY